MAILDAVTANPDNVHNQNPDQYAPDWNWTRDPLLPADVLFDNPQLTYGSSNEYGQQLVHRLRIAHALAARKSQQKESQARRAKKPGRKQHFENGQKVWLYCPYRKKGVFYKLIKPWTGPYRIRKRLGDYTYQIEWADGTARKPVQVHVTRLKAYITGRPITPRLPDPSSFEESLTNSPTNKIPPISAIYDTSRDKRASSQNITLLPNELELVGKSFQIGRK